MLRSTAILVLVAALLSPTGTAHASTAAPRVPEAVGFGGVVSSIDPDASQIGVDVLRRGGNAVDAAVAVAAALGVTDPFSAGVGGGGFFVHYDARTRRVSTLDGRETAPAGADEDLFVEDGKAIPFAEAVTSGLSVGVPGTPMTWQRALRQWGTLSLDQALRPAEQLARRGFTVDATFHRQVGDNAARFADFTSTRQLYLPGGAPPAVGSTFRNPDLADTYRELRERGVSALYRGDIGRDLVRTVRQPPLVPGATRVVRPGDLTAADLARYDVPLREPTRTRYRDLDVYGMAPPSSGGTTVGEALNILETTRLSAESPEQYLHRFLEASRLSFADRNRWVGDPAFTDVPARELLSQRFADSRACLISPTRAMTGTVAPGDPRRPAACGTAGQQAPTPYEGTDTTHLTVADRWGNVVAYTLTIEQEGGSGIVVPGRGFLLNNELTDFSFTPVTPGVPDPNLPGPGKRPRSSMSPTIVLRHGEPVLALGSPGGASIITTVLQVLTERLDRGRSLLDAVAAPRASQRNAATTQAEAAFLATPEAARLEALGHRFTSTAEIGAATAVERLPDGRWRAVAEPTRRGGGAARAVIPR
ncbi:gamma-glutamyltransferase [Saccharothrix coeruleofusca]|uniref:Glutathione hydrolase proenzyme n=1 Tax=Saccharothrix coeruleofusca TaxID=33919 RepID=A0A918ANE5_9PSEU|nr:gamma-glutamyltransferase [Saccharothrix coeruleofusca]MBP2337821.1 gamma-glutamyltranspeptidase/glutathione hydrolase [Saccharothrix coeruleofusca]GGP62498.1 gamma-glutamyltranspeptidase [Saccharothrix coeruleofusca]